MPGLSEIALGLFLPALFCGLILAAGELREGRLRGVAAGLAFGLSWFAAYLSWAGVPTWPSVGQDPAARDWLAWIVLLAGTSSLLGLAGLPARVLALVSRPVLSAALAGLSLTGWAMRRGSWAGPVVTFLAIWVAWTLAERWIPKAAGPRAPLALLLTAVGTSIASLFAQNAVFASLAGALAACLGASTVLALLSPSFRLETGASAVIALVLAGCVLNDWFFASLPPASGLLLAGSILAPGLLDLGGPREKRARASFREVLLAAGLALVPAVLAVWIAWTPGAEAY
jgi:hypothetical protein